MVRSSLDTRVQYIDGLLQLTGPCRYVLPLFTLLNTWATLFESEIPLHDVCSVSLSKFLECKGTVFNTLTGSFPLSTVQVYVCWEGGYVLECVMCLLTKSVCVCVSSLNQ